MNLETSMPSVPVRWRPPFQSAARYVDERPAGETLMEMARSVPDLPDVFFRRGVICINGDPIDRGLWHCIRPKPNTSAKPIVVTMHLALLGGGGAGGSSKSTIAIIASIAIIAATAITLGGGLALLPGFGALTAGSAAAQAVAGAIGVLGRLEGVRLPDTTG